MALERRNHLIHDDLIGWEPVGRWMTMRASSGPGGVTIWSSTGIQIPPGGGKYRLSIEQYEILPADQRSNAVTVENLPSEGLRLLYQDQIPL